MVQEGARSRGQGLVGQGAQKTDKKQVVDGVDNDDDEYHGTDLM